MDLSYEWTDWHLTPEGWVKGDYKTDFNREVVKVKPPANRVLTRRYIESISTVYAPLKITRKNIWSIRNVSEIKRLFRKYQYPNSLVTKQEYIHYAS